MTNPIESFKPSLIGDTHQLGPSSMQSEALRLLNDNSLLNASKLPIEPTFLSFDDNIWGTSPLTNDSTVTNASTATPSDKLTAGAHPDAPAAKSDSNNAAAGDGAVAPQLPVPGQVLRAPGDGPMRPHGSPEGHSGPVPPRGNAVHDWHQRLYTPPPPTIDETVKRAY